MEGWKDVASKSRENCDIERIRVQNYWFGIGIGAAEVL